MPAAPKVAVAVPRISSPIRATYCRPGFSGSWYSSHRRGSSAASSARIASGNSKASMTTDVEAAQGREEREDEHGRRGAYGHRLAYKHGFSNRDGRSDRDAAGDGRAHRNGRHDGHAAGHNRDAAGNDRNRSAAVNGRRLQEGGDAGLGERPRRTRR